VCGGPRPRDSQAFLPCDVMVGPDHAQLVQLLDAGGFQGSRVVVAPLVGEPPPQREPGGCAGRLVLARHVVVRHPQLPAAVLPQPPGRRRDPAQTSPRKPRPTGRPSGLPAGCASGAGPHLLTDPALPRPGHQPHRSLLLRHVARAVGRRTHLTPRPEGSGRRGPVPPKTPVASLVWVPTRPGRFRTGGV
jgi:hypothetical protein